MQKEREPLSFFVCGKKKIKLKTMYKIADELRKLTNFDIDKLFHEQLFKK